jgi:predicted DsbA family dithiol-disulfide isomerase
MAELTITEFTDPACPFAWSAEPFRRRLEWLYGDQLEWSVRMVGLSSSPDDYTDKGFTPEKLSSSLRSLSERHHMPMDSGLRPRMSATVPACRAVVATRLHDPAREGAILRQLRVRNFAGELLDDPGTLYAAASDIGIAPADLESWMSEEATERALEEDLELARHPTPEAVALKHKLASWSEDGWRYTCPSYEIVRIADGAHLSVPGFQPLLAYEVAIGNLLPSSHRREDPESVEEVLAWADEPLASIEVATVCGIELDDAREQLGRVAHREHLGFDGLWSLRDNDELGNEAVLSGAVDTR